MSTNTTQNPQHLTNNPTFFFFVFLLLFFLSQSPQVVVSSKIPLISPNSTIRSPNRTFELGYFNPDSGSNSYIGIWYAFIPLRTYVWVANRDRPVKNRSSSTVEITSDGRLAVTQDGNSTVWTTSNARPAVRAALQENGNFVLFDRHGRIVWQSFDFPTDTWLPGMHVVASTAITCWRSMSDPAPGPYALRLSPPLYGGFELVYGFRERYWSTGNWRGSFFAGVPEMTVPYIYSFQFDHPFTPRASFLYDLAPPSGRLLTRFVVDPSGQLRQYTWSPQTDNWNMFWSRPESVCRVYGLCGELGFCRSGSGRVLSPCGCPDGYTPSSLANWRAGDYSGGCRRKDNSSCGEDDGFVNMGPMNFDGNATTFSVPAASGNDRRSCEESCLKNCSCFGLNYDARTGECKNLFGNPLNLRNSTADGTDGSVFYIRVGKEALKPDKRNSKWKLAVLTGGLVGSVLLLGMAVLAIGIWKKRKSIQASYEDGSYSAMSLKVFSYKELHAATRGFSEKLGHGGFGAVFRGALPDSTPVAVKRLERPGGGDREFRAEVCTIGNIQHVNLVRLRGFCSENSHRLLVYDYMENGPLSVFLRRDGRCLSWEARFRIAVGTARGIAYLHEECRDCIIHCDIKPENILLDGELAPKVSDFGLAKLIGRDFSRVMTTMRGTWGYVAPEWISGVAITAKADVYSYGMTLLEIIGGRRNVESPPQATVPTPEQPKDEKWFFPPWAARNVIDGNLNAVVDARLGGVYDRGEAERGALVAVWCIQDEEAARPTMGMVVKMLEGAVDVPVPPVPQLLQALCDGDSFPEGGIVSEQGMLSSSSTGRGGRSGDMKSDLGSTGSGAGRNLS